MDTESTFQHLKSDTTAETEEDFLNRDISKDEVEAALQKLEKGKAVGPDNVYSDLIQKSNETLLAAITLLFQTSFEKGQLANLWKAANVKFLQKPGKENYHLPGSYRPISLTSILGKCLERIMNSRLYAFAEHNNLIDEEQEGFREKRGTTHALLRLTEDIQNGFKEGKTTAAVFLDMEKAFDSVWRQGLMVKLHKMGVKGKMWSWLENYLEGREAACCIGSYKSDAATTTMGLPQGSVLSPLLFNLYLSDIFEDTNCNKVKFADDGTIWKTHESIPVLEQEIQTDLDKISAWTKRWRMKLNARKTEYCLFSSKHEPIEDIKISLKGEDVMRVKTAKMLGVLLDEKLTYQEHIQYAAKKASKALGLLTKVGKSETISSESMLQLYKSLVVPHLEYASTIWHMSPHAKHLERIQRQGLTICLGAVGTASCESLEVQANVLPLDLRREEMAIREYSKILSKPTSSLIKQSALKSQENTDEMTRKPSPMSNMASLTTEMENLADIDTKCLEPEMSYLEYMQPSRRRPTYWNNLGSSKSRSKQQESQAKEEIEKILTDLPDQTVIAFTDGSCRGNPGPCGAGACLYLPGGEVLKLKQPVSKLSSILVGELVAIKITLEAMNEEIKKRPTRQVEILSDSQTAIGILTLGWECKAHQMLIQEIRLLWTQVENCGVRIKIDWTPGHAAIEGNEQADTLAKAAALEAESMERDASEPVSQADIKKAAKQMAVYKWQRRWDISEKGRQLYSLKPKVGNKKIDFSGCRNQKSLLQLQNGHCRLKDHLYTVGISESAGCDCGEAETIEHFLLLCPNYEVAREDMTRNIFLKTGLNMNSLNVPILLTNNSEVLETTTRVIVDMELDDFITRTERFKK